LILPDHVVRHGGRPRRNGEADTVVDDDLDEAERRIDDWQASLQERAARAETLLARLEGLRAEGAAADGLVKASVDQAGHLVELKLNDRVRSWPVERIASTVVEATMVARAALADQIREISRDSGLDE